ncbi:hypothetical protein MHL31_04820 [Lutibacter sp. A80]|uniref:hypothetical protein n=1 Tax=Lutibacter sp. A80 TaxID=2918453 RepID=UPI001F05CB41|nr:hypothetical protein [Lutibacter sp. A80]UMB61530.1 hypothetical protein MHL31_04820 [Lutibacter sp. A80]
MKKLITFFIAFTLLSCNDGDFDIPDFEFTEDINSCGETILYRLNSGSTEVIILQLSESDLGTTVGEKSYEISTTQNVIYRIFDDAIDSDYFCQEIPPATPQVLKELEAESGTIVINTIAIVDDENEDENEEEEIIGYTYEITISDLLFLDDNDRIFFETFYFGTK